MRKFNTAATLTIVLSALATACSQPGVQPTEPAAPEMPNKVDFPKPEIGESEQGLGSFYPDAPVQPTDPSIIIRQPGDDPNTPCAWPNERRPEVYVSPVSKREAQTMLYSNGGFYAMEFRIDRCGYAYAYVESAVVCVVNQYYDWYYYRYATPNFTAFGLNSIQGHNWVMAGFYPYGGCTVMYPYQGSGQVVGDYDNLLQLVGWMQFPQNAKFDLAIRFNIRTYDSSTWSYRQAKVWYTDYAGNSNKDIRRTQSLYGYY